MKKKPKPDVIPASMTGHYNYAQLYRRLGNLSLQYIATYEEGKGRVPDCVESQTVQEALENSDGQLWAEVTAAQPDTDPVNHPQHYTVGKIEVIDAIEDWKLGFHLGNVVKYVARAEHKGRVLEDLRKARWYLDRAIQRLEKK